ncbi:MAG: tRNA adenosine(34) deaminase TadA [Lachnospiraceae bacterium]|nr:tRNA adenosine(34) deaminase TadA [Lachnospiraceae bacterium]
MAGKRERRYLRKLEKEEAARKEAHRQELQDIKFMKQALKQACKAAELKEVPIGCVIVHEGKIIARGYNRRNCDRSVLAHAEISAIKKAAKKIGDWRLEECTLYVTLEPCQMCAGAIVQARIPRVVYACKNPKAGCAGSVLNILQMKEFNHRCEVSSGILEEECSRLLSSFFSRLRLNQGDGSAVENL